MQLQSDQINEIAKALSLAQAELEAVEKDKANPFYKSEYSTLQACIAVTREPMVKNGLAFTSLIADYNNEPYLVSTLTHSSGQWLRSYARLILDKKSCQGMGSAISYMRRYSLCAMIGLFQKDDDAQSIEPEDKKQNSEKKPKNELTEEDMEFITEWSDYFSPSVFNGYIEAVVKAKKISKHEAILKFKEDVEIFKKNVQAWCNGQGKTS